MSNKLIWNENETNTERFRQVYNFIDWLMFEMQEGRVPSMNLPVSITFVKLAENGYIDEITASEHSYMFIDWQPNTTYKQGQLLNAEGLLVKVLQDHTSQGNWTPTETPSLYKVVGIAENGIPYWSQAISSADAYMKGNEVMDEGKHWVSDIDYNVWKPGVYGWSLKEGSVVE